MRNEYPAIEKLRKAVSKLNGWERYHVGGMLATSLRTLRSSSAEAIRKALTAFADQTAVANAYEVFAEILPRYVPEEEVQ